MMLAGVVVRLVPPYLVRVLIDKVLTPRANAAWLTWILLALVGAAAGHCVLTVFIGRTTHFIGTRITKEQKAAKEKAKAEREKERAKMAKKAARKKKK